MDTIGFKPCQAIVARVINSAGRADKYVSNSVILQDIDLWACGPTPDFPRQSWHHPKIFCYAEYTSFTKDIDWLDVNPSRIQMLAHLQL